ncbi:MAG: hypothetical protein Q9209_005460 [Squamulea sp. 1 TL-2023]
MAHQSDHEILPPTEADSACDDNERLSAEHEDSLHQRDEQGSPDDILRLIPLNTEARRAFDSVVRLNKDGRLHEVHAQYIQVIGTRPLDCDADHATARDSDVTTDEAQSDDQGLSSQRIVHAGYFRVRFDLPSVSEKPIWVMGKGSEKKFGPMRNVDILLAAPRSEDALGLRAAHAYLQIHPTSGAWLLAAGAEPLEAEDQVVEAEGLVALYQTKTRFCIRNMQYLLQFVVQTPGMEQEYLKKRDQVFRDQGIPLPHTNISGIPLPTDTALETIVFRHGLGSGTFGNVYEGFFPKNGDLRVAKRVTLKSQREVATLEREIRALEQFDGREGILELLDWRTALNDRELLVSQYPLDVFLVHQKGVAFHEYIWSISEDWDLKQISENWYVKRSLCRQLLKGLAEIHQAGCMHRDITPMNILILPYEDPPQARLFDFGKFCDTSEAVDTRLAAWPFLPPELEDGKQNVYDQSLDIWMLGLALAKSWWPQIAHMRPRVEAHHNLIQEYLWDEKRECADLAHLIARMLNWDPSKRPSAALALKHRSLQMIAESTAPVKTSETKRLHDDEG